MFRVVAIALVVVLVAGGTVLAYTWGSPTGRTGAPGESTCASCHGNLNSGPGGVNITGPAGFSPGDTIEIFVEVSHDGKSKWGFQMTVLDGGNGPVGDLILVEPTRTQLSTGAGGRQYVMHTAAGTDPGVFDVSPGWTTQWASPPDPSDAATFYVCGAACNNAGSVSGDFMYTGSLAYDTTHAPMDGDSITWGKIKGLFR